MESEVIFLSGPMTGIDKFNFPKFDEVERNFMLQGLKVENPANYARRYKVEKVLSDPKEFRAMLQDEWDALARCSAIYLFNGWENSRGARRELQIALELGLKVYIEGVSEP